LVRALSAGRGAPDAAGKEELAAKMGEYLPEAPLAWMIGLGADAVAAVLAAGSRRTSL
jgi:hypothetical protein